MIVSSLIFLIVIISLMQDNKRRLTALVFSLMTLVHELFFKGLPGYWYFLSAVLIDVSIIGIIARLKFTSKMTERLINIGFCFIIMNTSAWLMWEQRINYESIYELTAAVLYFCVIVSMLSWDGIEDGKYKVSHWLDSVYVGNMASHFNYKKL